MRVVAPDGSQVGVLKIEEAQYLANQLGLDLVEVAPDAKPPVCRMMDYGKYKYEAVCPQPRGPQEADPHRGEGSEVSAQDR